MVVSSQPMGTVLTGQVGPKRSPGFARFCEAFPRKRPRRSRRPSIRGVPVRRLDDRTDGRGRKDVMTMMMYDMSRQYQVERRMSTAEQRRADEQLGHMAARTSELWRR